MELPGHIAICGGSESGKSTAAKWLAKQAFDVKTPVLVLDPYIHEGGWFCDWATKDPEKFLRKAKASSGCVLVVDECGETIGKSGYAEEMKWLVRAARHQGHKTVLCMHRATDVPPTFRDNISNLFLFPVWKDSAEIWAEAMMERTLIRAGVDLPQYHFILKRRFQPAQFFKPLPNVSKK